MDNFEVQKLKKKIPEIGTEMHDTMVKLYPISLEKLCAYVD